MADSLKVFGLMIFGISLALYLTCNSDANNCSMPFLQLIAAFGTDVPITETILSGIVNIFTNPLFLAGLGLAAVSAFLTGGGGYSVTFLIPVLMLTAFSTYLFMPLDYILNTPLPDEIKLILVGFLQLITFTFIVAFVRGG